MINLDKASGVPMSIKAISAYVFAALWYPHNPNAIHAGGVRSRVHLTGCLKRIARVCGTTYHHLALTSGGTEGNALAILGHVLWLRERGHKEPIEILMSAGEHASLSRLHTHLAPLGATIVTVPLTSTGSVALADVLARITPQTRVVSIATLLGETGAIPPVREIFTRIRALYGDSIMLHTDASQAALCHDVSPQRLAADVVTIDGQKLYGPRGVGVLVGKGVDRLHPLFGGSTLRPGTPPVPLISAFDVALSDAVARRKKRALHTTTLRTRLIQVIQSAAPHARIPAQNLASPIVPVAFPGIDAEYLAHYLSKHGILAATGSACSEGSTSAAYTYMVGEDASSVIRFSFDTSLSEHALNTLQRRLRLFMNLVDRGVGRTYSEDISYAP